MSKGVTFSCPRVKSRPVVLRICTGIMSQVQGSESQMSKGNIQDVWRRDSGRCGKKVGNSINCDPLCTDIRKPNPLLKWKSLLFRRNNNLIFTVLWLSCFVFQKISKTFMITKITPLRTLLQGTPFYTFFYKNIPYLGKFFIIENFANLANFTKLNLGEILYFVAS